MNCTLCNKEIILIPSARQRAERLGGKPSDYTRLFTEHATCTLVKRKVDTDALVKRIKK